MRGLQRRERIMAAEGIELQCRIPCQKPQHGPSLLTLGGMRGNRIKTSAP